jgi:hypothetical protein
MKWYWYREREGMSRALGEPIGVKAKKCKNYWPLKGLFVKGRVVGRNN